MSTPAIHLIDDDAALRDALSFMLSAHDYEVHSWDSPEAFLLDYRGTMRGCIILDVRMARMNGPECFALLKARGCHMPVIFLTGHADVALAVDMLRSGACHFIEKPPQEDQLIAAITEALRQDQALCSEADAKRERAQRIELLSPREREVMQRILDGRLNKQIADELNISMRTVEVHRANIFDKMGVRSAVELASLLAQ